ncbi:MAG: hypothetical protein AAGI51_04725 [Pseudomonadota bacterium]
MPPAPLRSAAALLFAAAAALPAGAQTAVYPAEGQSAEQQAADQQACAQDASAQSGHTPGQESQAGQNAVRGAARGAVGGAVIGGISGGDAGTGAAAGAAIRGVGSGARTKSQESQAAQKWNSVYSACLQARGYTTG